MNDIVNAYDKEESTEVEVATDATLSMSDDDFLNSSPDTLVPEKEEAEQENQEESVEEQEEETVEEKATEEAPEKSPETVNETEGETPAESEQEATQEEEPINYEESYKKLMAPFKANGKEIKLDKPEDLIKLAQMGANYTKKMQALQPHLRMMRMLENNGLADENKLNYLIDLHNKNPKAIQQLIKDSGIDPLDIDSNSEETYKPNNHTVPETEMAFSSAITEVREVAEGQELLDEVGTQWDKASKEIIWSQPDILRHMTQQKQTGVYQTIVSEIERQKMFGELQNVPFVQAYLVVGQHLQEQGKLTNSNEPKVLERRIKEPAPVVKNGDKAKAAAPIRQTPNKVPQDFNPLSMSDEDFMNSDLAKRM